MDFLYDDSSFSRMRTATTEHLDQYQLLCGVKPVDFPDSVAFWNLIVLTTADELQKRAFDIQIEVKRRRGHIPIVDTMVIADPPGPKIGNGGSTLHVLAQLEAAYPNGALDRLRVLILHTGGQSKRLPTCSALGKIFALLPLQFSVLGLGFQATALDVVLALSLPIAPLVPSGGCFVVCADTILPFALDKDLDLLGGSTGFVALAHPSSLETGLSHGVYVLEKPLEASSHRSCFSVCRRVLQKPSEARMRQQGAIVERKVGDRPSEMVFTDSAFWFDASTRKLLFEIYNELSPLDVEIDAYGDFLQSLGSDRLPDYINNISNVTPSSDGTCSSKIFKDRKYIFDRLGESRLSVLVLNDSCFLHIGSTCEYLTFMAHGSIFSRIISSSDAGSKGANRFVHSRLTSTGRGDGKKRPISSPDVRGLVMNSVVDSFSSVPADSVVESCAISGPFQLGAESIISRCSVDATLTLSVPNRVLMATIAVNYRVGDDAQVRYVTVAFGIDDDLKKSFDSLKEVCFLGRPLGETLRADDWTVVGGSRSLWNAPLFLPEKNMETSFASTANLLNHVSNGNAISLNIKNGFSLQDAIRNKNVDAMLKFQEKVDDDVVFKSSMLLC